MTLNEPVVEQKWMFDNMKKNFIPFMFCLLMKDIFQWSPYRDFEQVKTKLNMNLQLTFYISCYIFMVTFSMLYTFSLVTEEASSNLWNVCTVWYCTSATKQKAYHICVEYSVLYLFLAKNKHCFHKSTLLSKGWYFLFTYKSVSLVTRSIIPPKSKWRSHFQTIFI